MPPKSKKRVYFRFQAPNAKTVSVLGSFNDWEERPMKKIRKANGQRGPSLNRGVMNIALK